MTDLAVARGGVPVLGGVSFALAPGAALILRGPNGSGKTTLLRTIAGLQPPLSGKIDGASETVAYAGHADGLKAMLSVAENLRFWAAIYGQREIAPALAAYGLAPLADRLAGTLSAGQKRRAGLARLHGHGAAHLGAGRADRLAGCGRRSRFLRKRCAGIWPRAAWR